MSITTFATRQLRDALVTTAKIAANAVTLGKLGALTTKGDVLTHDGTDHKRLGVGTDGQALVADSNQADGIKWGDAGVSDHGDLSGLGDDDHPQYALADGTRGDFAATGHTHTLADVTDSGAAASKGVTGADDDAVTGTAGASGNFAEWNADGDLVDSGQSDASYADASHNHDGRYYTESETDSLLSGKADTSHTHTLADVTDSGGLASQDTVTDAEMDSETATDGQVLTADGSGNAAWEDAPAGSGGGPSLTRDSVLAPHANLTIANNSGSPNSQVDIAADELLATNPSDATDQVRLTSVSVTGDITASGANGLDSGSESSSTWYHLWVIHDESGPTTAALLSTSSTAPTLPSGYTHQAYVGAIRNDSSSDFKPSHQIGTQASQFPEIAASGLSNTTATAVDLSAYVPPTARLLSAGCQIRARNIVGAQVFVSGTANRIGERSGRLTDLGVNEDFSVAFTIPLIETQTVYVRSNTAFPDCEGQIASLGWRF